MVGLEMFLINCQGTPEIGFRIKGPMHFTEEQADRRQIVRKLGMFRTAITFLDRKCTAIENKRLLKTVFLLQQRCQCPIASFDDLALSEEMLLVDGQCLA